MRFWTRNATYAAFAKRLFVCCTLLQRTVMLLHSHPKLFSLGHLLVIHFYLPCLQDFLCHRSITFTAKRHCKL